ncbi:MAG TPA: hypothetical protein VM677_25555 [Actinokineospora sp.]|jgi:hypothetical protein|nr:hypothetical protein [Actinokineospora sp.]
MTATPEEADLACHLVALATKMDKLPARLRHHASGLIVGWATPEQTDALAEVMEETARQIRLHRPATVIHRVSAEPKTH